MKVGMKFIERYWIKISIEFSITHSKVIPIINVEN